MQPLIAGATGVVGRHVIRSLLDAGARPRALVRDVERARAVLGDRVHLVQGDMADPASLRGLCKSGGAVFLATPNTPDQIDLECNLIDAAASAGAGRLVKLSALGASADADVGFWRTHAVIEHHLAQSGLGFVTLRPAYFMTNLLGLVTPIQAFDIAPSALGAAAVAMIDPADIAEVAAALLLGATPPTETLDLTGPEALTFKDVAERLSRLLGRQITAVDMKDDEAVDAMIGAGVPPTVAQQILEVLVSLRRGRQSTPTTAVEAVTGRPARSVDAFLAANSALFNPA